MTRRTASPARQAAPATRTGGSGRPGRASGARDQDERLRIRRFDADRKDVVLSFREAISTRPTARQLLWIDIRGDLQGDKARQLADRFDLEPRTRRALEVQGDRPHLELHGGYFHIRVAAEPDAREPDERRWLDIVAGPNVVISLHRAELASLDDLDERIEDDTGLGALDAPTFVASLLDLVVTSYFSAVDAVEDEVDDLDAKSLRDEGRRELLADLVALRRRIARLRRILTDHRAVFALLTSPGMVQLAGDADAAAALQAVGVRFEAALGAVEDSREILLGSFDVYMTRTAQRTNDVMKVLALATVLLLPGSLIAGLLGMNVTIPLSKDDPLSFWIVVGGVLGLALALVAIARVRRWL